MSLANISSNNNNNTTILQWHSQNVRCVFWAHDEMSCFPCVNNASSPHCLACVSELWYNESMVIYPARSEAAGQKEEQAGTSLLSHCQPPRDVWRARAARARSPWTFCRFPGLVAHSTERLLIRQSAVGSGPTICQTSGPVGHSGIDLFSFTKVTLWKVTPTTLCKCFVS